MNVLLIGGAGTFINNLIVKLKKEGHRVYLLTGSRYDDRPYQKVFEKYNFSYDSSCLNEIFESIRPDLTIFMGAYDTNFNWEKEEDEAVKYSARMMNILMAYVMAGTGRFVYLSSSEVYSGDYDNDITEDVPLNPSGFKGMVLSQAEEMCASYLRSTGKDIVILRLDNVFVIPMHVEDATDICCRMITHGLYDNVIPVDKNNVFALTYLTDAIECIYKVSTAKEHTKPVYNISSSNPVSEGEIAEKISNCLGFSVKTVVNSEKKTRKVLSNEAFTWEFGFVSLCDFSVIIRKVVDQMKRYRRAFVFGEAMKKSLRERIFEKVGSSFKLLIPFIENIIAFVIFTLLNIWAGNTNYFEKMDFYFLYVLLFAVFYGQQQAAVSATLAVAGYIISQIAGNSDALVFVDSGTYLWIAQLFIVGLVVGYMRDTITKMRREHEEDHEYLSLQLRDIKDINDSNVRVKDALETQIINQNDSVGKIYSITSRLDLYNQEDVLFQAAAIVSDLMKSEDVAVYTVGNSAYARLFSYTSEKAKHLGNSVKFKELGEMYEALSQKKVFINRQLKDELPVMASAIYSDDGEIQTIIMIWTLPWESMTLGQANQLVIIGALIRSAVVRANKYLAALVNQMYVGESHLMEPDAFKSLSEAYMRADDDGLTECVVLKLDTAGTDNVENSKLLYTKLRDHDYVGMLEDGNIGVLLANTDEKDAEFVIARLKDLGFECLLLEGNYK